MAGWDWARGNSLREVIQAAEANLGADTIEFDLPPGSAIELTRGSLPAIGEDLTIAGPGAELLSVGDNRPP